MIDITKIDFKKMNGLVPAIVQSTKDQRVLMLGYMNQEAVEKTLETKKVTFWSRSKKRLWEKGETSGNSLKLIEIRPDCDSDALLVFAKPAGPTCHTGKDSCFGTESTNITFLQTLADLIGDRKKQMPEGSYTTSLFQEGLTKILEKVEEESEEVCRAAREETKQRLIEESGDLLYHLLVLLAEKEIGVDTVVKELMKRRS